MSNYIPTRRNLQEVVLYYFNSNQLVGDAHRMLIDAYGQGIISRKTCYLLYKRFEKGDFNINRSTNKRLKKKQRIEEIVRLTLENPRMSQEMMAAKVGISQETVSRYLKSQEFKNRLKEKRQEQSSIPLEFTTPRLLRKEQLIEEIVRLTLEDPNMSLRKMAAKVGKSQMTVFRYLKSQEYQNKLEEKKQEQSSLPLEFTTQRRRYNGEQIIEELVRLRFEDPSITQAKMAAKVGKSQRTVSQYLRSQEYQNKLKEKKQENSSIPPERTTLKRQHRELEDEKLVHLIPENPRMNQDELAKQLEMSLPTASKRVNTQEIQNNIKEKWLEPSSIPKKRPTSKSPRIELEDEELVHNMDEFPYLTPDELAEMESGISISIAQTFINSMKKYNQ